MIDMNSLDPERGIHKQIRMNPHTPEAVKKAWSDVVDSRIDFQYMRESISFNRRAKERYHTALRVWQKKYPDAQPGY